MNALRSWLVLEVRCGLAKDGRPCRSLLGRVWRVEGYSWDELVFCGDDLEGSRRPAAFSDGFVFVGPINRRDFPDVAKSDREWPLDDNHPGIPVGCNKHGQVTTLRTDWLLEWAAEQPAAPEHPFEVLPRSSAIV